MGNSRKKELEDLANEIRYVIKNSREFIEAGSDEMLGALEKLKSLDKLPRIFRGILISLEEIAAKLERLGQPSARRSGPRLGRGLVRPLAVQFKPDSRRLLMY